MARASEILRSLRADSCSLAPLLRVHSGGTMTSRDRRPVDFLATACPVIEEPLVYLPHAGSASSRTRIDSRIVLCMR